ncbi:transcription antiterminator [Bacillus ginsengihumi]|uniref:Transcription antiterminator n=2 Tax=Heyndrickxia ginsengihumi TaxID=363870 RepID=A0A6M0P9T1_9BACI|nr:transcription antiterminator [Heyndrickxia ginsengihumi]
MCMISNRQKEILQLLIKTSEPVTADWLAKEIGVSDRTIRSEVKALQSECEQFGIAIHSIRGKGYQIKMVDPNKFQAACETIGNDGNESGFDYSDQQSRVVYMIRRFLLEKEFIKLETFEDEMFISKSTVQHDLKMVKEVLEKYQLTLMNRPHYGTKVVGDEYMKRLCLSNYIFRNIDFSASRDGFSLLDEQLYKKIKDIIIMKVNDYKIEISDIALENLATHLTIACKRIEEGFLIGTLEHDFYKTYPFEKLVAHEIVKEVEALTGLHFPDAEIDYIIVHLVGTKLLHQDELTEYGEYDEVSHIVSNMLEKLRLEMNWDFRDDHELIQALTLHIRPAMNRLRYHMNIRNPFLKEIKMKYPVAFEGAAVASTCMEEYLAQEVGEHEIAYIALHIGVALERKSARKQEAKRVLIVCASGVGSAKLLYYRLQRMFGNELDIVDTIHYYKLREFNLSSIDLIISTVPIHEDLGIPVQVVHTFLEEEDIQHINRKLYASTDGSLAAYLDISRVFIHQDFHDKDSVLAFLCDQLLTQGLVPKDYINLVQEREMLAPTCFGNLVAIPHPMTPVTEKTFWTVCTLKRPVIWHERQMVQFVCLLNISKHAKGDLAPMYQHLISIIENQVTVQKIIQTASAEDLIKLFLREEYKKG